MRLRSARWLAVRQASSPVVPGRHGLAGREARPRKRRPVWHGYPPSHQAGLDAPAIGLGGLGAGEKRGVAGLQPLDEAEQMLAALVLCGADGCGPAALARDLGVASCLARFQTSPANASTASSGPLDRTLGSGSESWLRLSAKRAGAFGRRGASSHEELPRDLAQDGLLAIMPSATREASCSFGMRLSCLGRAAARERSSPRETQGRPGRNSRPEASIAEGATRHLVDVPRKLALSQRRGGSWDAFRRAIDRLRHGHVRRWPIPPRLASNTARPG